MAQRDAPNEMKLALREQEMILMRVKGMQAGAIANALGLAETDVSSLLAKAAERVRARNKAAVDEAFMIAGLREELLWELAIQPQLDSMRALQERGVTPPFDKDLVAAAIKIAERTAKRMGLDAHRTTSADFMKRDVGDLEMAEIATFYNIDISMMEIKSDTTVP